MDLFKGYIYTYIQTEQSVRWTASKKAFVFIRLTKPWDSLHKIMKSYYSDTGKLICLIYMSVRESLYKSLTENNWETRLATN